MSPLEGPFLTEAKHDHNITKHGFAWRICYLLRLATLRLLYKQSHPKATVTVTVPTRPMSLPPPLKSIAVSSERVTPTRSRANCSCNKRSKPMPNSDVRTSTSILSRHFTWIASACESYNTSRGTVHWDSHQPSTHHACQCCLATVPSQRTNAPLKTSFLPYSRDG